MNVRITFADGTHEDRDGGTPVCEDRNVGWPPRAEYRLETMYERGGWYVEDNFYPPLDERQGYVVSVWRVSGATIGSVLCGHWESAEVETVSDSVERLTAERDTARAALQSLLDDCATWRAHRGATGMGAHLPHDLMSASPSVVQHIERATKRGLGQ